MVAYCVVANMSILHSPHSLCVFPAERVQGTVYCVAANMSTLEALSQMARDHKSSLGVTDPTNGQLIGNLSVSDLRCVPGARVCVGGGGYEVEHDCRFSISVFRRPI